MARIIEHHGWIAVAAVVVLVAGLAAAFDGLTSTQPFTVEDALDDYRLGLEDEARQQPAPSSDPVAPDQADVDGAEERGEPDGPSDDEAEEERQAEEERRAERERQAEEEQQEQQEQERQAEQREQQTEPERQAEKQSEPSVARPEPGVYRYRTHGEGRVDVPGARHTYPEETTITVRHDECGYTTRWRPVSERWEENELCVASDRVAVAAMTNYREFMGESVHSEMTCDEGLFLLPPDPQAGVTWTGQCRDEANNMRTTVHGEVVRRGMVEAAGERIEALQLRFESEVSGDSEGYQNADRVVAAETGLLLHASSQTEVTSDGPMGRRVTYREEYTLDLLDLQPSR